MISNTFSNVLKMCWRSQFHPHKNFKEGRKVVFIFLNLLISVETEAQGDTGSCQGRGSHPSFRVTTVPSGIEQSLQLI